MSKVDNQEVKSRRDQAVERLRSRHPDKDFADDESLWGQVYDDYDEYDNQLNGYKEREKAFSDMFTSDPRSAHFVMNWRDGADPTVEFVRQFGEDMLEAANDPDKLEAIAEANKEFVERVAKEKELQAQYDENLKESLDVLDQFQASHGLSDDDVNAVMKHLAGIVSDGILGKFSLDSMEMALKAINHDADVEGASLEGEVRGRNAKIDEKLRRSQQGDGTVNLAGSNNSAKRPARSIFDVARDAT